MRATRSSSASSREFRGTSSFKRLFRTSSTTSLRKKTGLEHTPVKSRTWNRNRTGSVSARAHAPVDFGSQGGLCTAGCQWLREVDLPSRSVRVSLSLASFERPLFSVLVGSLATWATRLVLSRRLSRSELHSVCTVRPSASSSSPPPPLACLVAAT